MNGNTIRVYFRNDAEGSYRTALVDKTSKRLLTSLDDWLPDPTYQVIRKPNGHAFAAVGGTDVTGSMLRVLRKAHGLSLADLARAVDCTAQTLQYHESKRGVVTAQALPAIYRALRIDHRPAPIEPVVLSNLETFLGFTGAQIARLFGASPSTYYSWKAGGPVGSSWGDPFFKFYCMMPDLTAGVPQPDLEVYENV